MKKAVVSVLVFLCLVAFSEAHVAITAPAVISAPGYYVLTANTQTTLAGGNAIEVNADDVTIDLQGHTLENLGTGPTGEAVGIWVSDHKNATIINGTIKGYWYGIVIFSASAGHRIENIRAAQSTYVGIYAKGNGMVIKGNQVVETGSSVAFPSGHAYGIVVLGNGNLAEGNAVSNVFPAGSGVGRGIVFFAATNSLAVGNRLANIQHGGIEFAVGESGKYRDNITIGVPNPYFGGADIGNNQ